MCPSDSGVDHSIIYLWGSQSQWGFIPTLEGCRLSYSKVVSQKVLQICMMWWLSIILMYSKYAVFLFPVVCNRWTMRTTSKKQCETAGSYFPIVVRPEGPPIVYLQVGAALLQLIYCWSPIISQVEYISDSRQGYRCNRGILYVYPWDLISST